MHMSDSREEKETNNGLHNTYATDIHYVDNNFLLPHKP